MGKRGKVKKQRRQAEKRRKAKAGVLERMTATLPGGRTVKTTVNSGQSWPTGTMLTWNELSSRGRPEMRWTVVGGGWPFDD